jgi:hypothetical protein
METTLRDILDVLDGNGLEIVNIDEIAEALDINYQSDLDDKIRI